MPQPRKQPLRTCVACRITSDKRRMLRFVRTADGQVECDASGKRAGRGAYLCTQGDCFAVARKRRLFDRALKTSLNDADYQRLQDQYQELCGAVTDSLRTVD